MSPHIFTCEASIVQYTRNRSALFFTLTLACIVLRNFEKIMQRQGLMFRRRNTRSYTILTPALGAGAFCARSCLSRFNAEKSCMKIYRYMCCAIYFVNFCVPGMLEICSFYHPMKFMPNSRQACRAYIRHYLQPWSSVSIKTAEDDDDEGR